MKIGFIGLGIMGKPMAKNLAKAGHELVVLDHKQQAMDELIELGAKQAKNGADLAPMVEVIITMLPNSPQVKEVILGKDGVIETVKAGTIVVDTSSIAPLASREIGAALASKGVEMLDAPVSGGEPKAIDGTIAVMVGGKKSIFDRCYEVLMDMAGSVTYVGQLGAGNTAKLCNQIIVAANITAISEALMLAQKAGVSCERLYQAIRGGMAGSTVMDAKVPMMLEHHFEPGFRIDLHIKDMNNVLETGHDVGAPMPMAEAVTQIMQAVSQDGYGLEDHSSILKYYEKLAGTKVESVRGND